MIILPLILL